jgi:hypothetical protein
LLTALACGLWAAVVWHNVQLLSDLVYEYGHSVEEFATLIGVLTCGLAGSFVVAPLLILRRMEAAAATTAMVLVFAALLIWVVQSASSAG